MNRCAVCECPMVPTAGGEVCPICAIDDPAVWRWLADEIDRARRDADLLALARGEQPTVTLGTPGGTTPRD